MSADDRQRIADAIRRTLEAHATCIEDAGDTPFSDWECDLIVLARVAEEAARPEPGAAAAVDGRAK